MSEVQRVGAPLNLGPARRESRSAKQCKGSLPAAHRPGVPHADPNRQLAGVPTLKG